MKRIDKDHKKGIVLNRKKVIVYMIIGLGIGLCVGYTVAKLAQYLMNVH